MPGMTASSRNSLFQRGKWRLETACAAHDDGSRHFSAGPFRILGLRFCRCVKKEQNRRRGSFILPELGGLLRSRRPGAKTGARRSIRGYQAGGSIAPSPSYSVGTASLYRPSEPPRSSLRFTFSKFQSKSGAGGAHKKTIRIIYLNPSASRPLPSKTHRDTNLEGFLWRCL